MEEKIKNWLSAHSTSKNTRKKIRAYLVGKGLDIEFVGSGAGQKVTFNDFIDFVYIQDALEKYICCTYPIKINNLPIFGFNKPKDGEFWYVKCKDSGYEWIFQKKESNYITEQYYSISLPEIGFSIHGRITSDNNNIKTLRPATESEKQQLISTVEKECKKTWNGEKWVDIVKPFPKLMIGHGSGSVVWFVADRCGIVIDGIQAILMVVIEKIGLRKISSTILAK